MTTGTAALAGAAALRPSGRGAAVHSFGFWVAAVGFLLNMAFSSVPTPLYALYAQRDGFSTFTITLIYAAYAIGVIGSLFFGGHISDRVGRKPVFIAALLINVASAGLFLIAPGIAGLVVARVISGVSVGLATATATAYLAELYAGARSGKPGRTGAVVASAANLGGIGWTLSSRGSWRSSRPIRSSSRTWWSVAPS